MAQVELSFFTTGNRSVEGGSMPVARGTGMATERIEAGAQSVVASTVASGNDASFVRIWTDADVWVATGPAPSAAEPAVGETAPGCRVAAGMPVELALEKDDRVAVAALA